METEFDNIFQYDRFSLTTEIHFAGFDELDAKERGSSVEIISANDYFSPYKSEMHRVICDEYVKLEKNEKRARALATWEWDSVIDITSSDDDWEDEAIYLTKQQHQLCLSYEAPKSLVCRCIKDKESHVSEHHYLMTKMFVVFFVSLKVC